MFCVFVLLLDRGGGFVYLDGLETMVMSVYTRLAGNDCEQFLLPSLGKIE
jgi:hypothetical protein